MEYAFDAYGSKIAMRTFRTTSVNFSTSSWPLSDDGGDPQNPIPSSWSSGDKTTWTFDGPTGLVTSKTDALASSVGYSYWPDGKLETRTWARGIATTYTYDPYTAELTNKSYSDGATPSIAYSYDRLGHPSTVAETFTGPSTVTTGLQYNVPGKLTQENFDSSYFSGRQLAYQVDTTNTGTLGRTIGYELGTSGSPYADQGVSYNYDATGRFNYVSFYGSPAFTYNFVSNSNLIGGITDAADNWSQARTWDPNRDLMDSIQTSAESVAQGNFAYIYDPDGRRTSRVETGALFSRYPAGGLGHAYTYDSQSEVTGDQTYHSTNPNNFATASPVVGRGFTFSYDPIGNRTTSSVDGTQTTNYTSNQLNQISGRTVPGFYSVSGFAPSGATVTLNGSAISSGQFNGQFFSENITASNSSAPLWITAQLSSSLGGSVTTNAFIPQTPETCRYDADGNLLSDGRWDYTWDAENRLSWITTYGSLSGESLSVWNSGAPLISVGFVYDYQGRRIFKKVMNWNGSTWVKSSETKYLYSKSNLIADYSVNLSTGALTLAHSYLWGLDLSGTIHGAGGVGGLLAMYDTASGDYELPIHDANGNIHGLTDRVTGQITAAYEYSPFGQTLRSNGTFAQANPFRFSTKYTDNETDLINYGHRYYNPALGRFLGRDRKQEKGGLHLYGFAGNNGINRWDYLGMDPNSALASLQNEQAQLNALVNAGPAAYNAMTPAQQQAYQEAWYYKSKYGAYNSGGPSGPSGGGGFMSGILAPIAGSGDSTFYSVNSGNPATGNYVATRTYTVAGTQYTVSNDPSAAPPDGSVAYNVNGNTGAYSAVANGYVAIGPTQNLGTVGGSTTAPAPSTSSNYDPNLAADNGAIWAKYQDAITRTENNYNTLTNAGTPNAFDGLDYLAVFGEVLGNAAASGLGAGGAATEELAEAGAAETGSMDAASSLQGNLLNQQLAAEEAAGVRAPTSIGSWSEHVIDQVAGRDGGLGVSRDALEGAFNNPSSIEYAPSQYGPTFRYTGNNATIVVNPQGNVVTGWATNSGGLP